MIFQASFQLWNSFLSVEACAEAQYIMSICTEHEQGVQSPSSVLSPSAPPRDRVCNSQNQMLPKAPSKGFLANLEDWWGGLWVACGSSKDSLMNWMMVTA